ncbi:MAG TPA: C45 family peptidase [Anaerolineales bacterium]
MIRFLELSGDHYQMGWQHGRQVSDLRPQIFKAMNLRLAFLRKNAADTQMYVDEISEYWQAENCPTWEMLQGIAEALELPWENYFVYTMASYLADRAILRSPARECSVWAAAGRVTGEGQPVLVKNRDYRPNHRGLQCLANAKPARGYRYIYLTSAGSPGVFSSGMNEFGLAVADTHVSPTEMGPGLPRYSAMMHILEGCRSVEEAVDYLNGVRHVGDGTLVLADAGGDIAVFETGHHRSGLIRSDEGFVVSSNHFRSAGLRDAWLDRSPVELLGSTQARYAKMSQALQAARGAVDPGWAKQLMGSHGDALSALCRHAELDPKATTISTIIFEPRARRVQICDGQPCQNKFEEWTLG